MFCTCLIYPILCARVSSQKRLQHKPRTAQEQPGLSSQGPERGRQLNRKRTFKQQLPFPNHTGQKKSTAPLPTGQQSEVRPDYNALTILMVSGKAKGRVEARTFIPAVLWGSQGSQTIPTRVRGGHMGNGSPNPTWR